MTYEELYREANRFQLDPDTEVVCDHKYERATGLGISTGPSGYADLGLRHRVTCVDKPERPSSWIYNVEIVCLATIWPQGIQGILENRWLAFAHHELQEWLTRDGEHLYDPHGVRNLQEEPA